MTRARSAHARSPTRWRHACGTATDRRARRAASPHRVTSILGEFPVNQLRALWETQRHTPFPAGSVTDRRLQEVALYESWLGSLVEGVLAAGGTLSRPHRLMLDVRRAEGNQPIWAAAAAGGEPLKSYVARLLEIESLLAEL